MFFLISSFLIVPLQLASVPNIAYATFLLNNKNSLLLSPKDFSVFSYLISFQSLSSR